MWKSRVKKAFTLLEVMISISVFLILFFCAVTIQINSIRLKSYNEKINEYRDYMEIVRNRILYNSSYEEVKEIKNSGMRYVNSRNLNDNILRTEEIPALLDPFTESSNEYIRLSVSGEEVLRIELELHGYILGEDEIIACVFFKGNY